MKKNDKLASPRNGFNRLPHNNQQRFAMAGLAAAVSIFASGQTLAATEPNQSELQAENARLKQELQQAQNQLRALAPTATTTAATEAVTTVSASPIQPAVEGKLAKNVDELPVETLERVVVHARDRDEKLQNVPIPVSAISAKTLEQTNSLTMQDFTKLTPNLFVQAGNARQQSIAIRGVGKNVSNDALQPSVGVVIDGVPSAFILQAWGDFPDLDHVEVLRGPQGTLQGMNTTMGVINVVSKAPSFTPQSSFELSIGDHHAIGGKASVTGPIRDGVLAYRASIFAEKRDGPYQDIALQHTNETFGERNRLGGKLQFLLLPSDNVTAKLTLERQESAELLPWGEPPLLGDPKTFPNGSTRTTTYTSRLSRAYFGGYKPVVGNWDQFDNQGSEPTRSTTNGVTADINWSLNGALDGYNLTSITAYRDSMFDAKNAAGWTHFEITRSGALINQSQVSQELRISSPVAKERRIDYTAGVYLMKSNVDALDRNMSGQDGGAFYATNAQYSALSGAGIGTQLLRDSINGLAVYTDQKPNASSYALFGQLNWHFDEKSTVTLGLRRTTEDRSNSYSNVIQQDSTLGNIPAANLSSYYTGATAAQLSAAQGIRSAKLTGIGSVPELSFNNTSYSWLVNPSYKLTDDVLLYTSLGRGVKSGAVQFNTTTLTPYIVAPEKSLDFELGIKGAFLHNELVWNTNLYETRLTDYQQQLSVFDPVTTAATGNQTYRSYLGSVAGVKLRGVESDGSWTPNRNWRVTFGVAFSQAFYSDFKDSPCNADSAGNAVAGSCDYTGKQLPFAPKFTNNLGLSYQHPVKGDLLFNTFVNNTFRSRANYNASLSDFGQWGGYSITDAGIGIATQDGKWEIGLVTKNLFDTHFVTDITPYSTSAAITATPGERRYVGLVMRAKQF